LLLVALPQREVARITLAPWIGVLRRLHVIDALPAQLAIGRPGPHVEVDVAGAILSGISVACVNQDCHELDHLSNVAGRPRFVGRRLASQQVVRGVQRPFVDIGVCPPGPSLLFGLDQDLVVDVGHIGDDRDLEPGVFEPAPQDIENDLFADMSDMRRVLDGQPAVVDPHLARAKGHEVPDLAGCGVIQAKTHQSSLSIHGAFTGRPCERRLSSIDACVFT
jgi:hypothetical protein